MGELNGNILPINGDDEHNAGQDGATSDFLTEWRAAVASSGPCLVELVGEDAVRKWYEEAQEIKTARNRQLQDRRSKRWQCEA